MRIGAGEGKILVEIVTLLCLEMPLFWWIKQPSQLTCGQRFRTEALDIILQMDFLLSLEAVKAPQ